MNAAEHIRRENALASHRTIREAAASLGISASSLETWAKRHGHAVSHEERHERTTEALRKHGNVIAAARELGITARAIYARIAKHPELRALVGGRS